VLLAAAYRDLAARLASTAARRALLGMSAALVAFELAAVPLKTFPMTVSPLFEQLPEDARSLVELPPGIADINVRQMVHGRRAVGGYVTNLALDAEHEELAKAWKDAWDLVVRDHSTRRLEELVAESGVDLVVLDRQEYENVVPPYAGQVVWRPLCLARGLVWAKQDAPYREVPTRGLARATAMLVDLYGKPILSDDRVLVFRAR
jgi:hypothetical protein